MGPITTDNTPDRILDQAERLFATKGFEAVSVREITGAADCNLAAINYHFGNKEKLYLEVFRQRWLKRTQRVRESFSRQLADKAQPSNAQVIEAMARAFLDGPLNDEERGYHSQLMQRELAYPSQALDMVVSEVMRPYQEQLSDLIRPNLSPPVDEDRLRLCLLGILGMTIYFTFARTAVSRVTGYAYNQQFKANLIRHITSFALNGLGALAEE